MNLQLPAQHRSPLISCALAFLCLLNAAPGAAVVNWVIDQGSPTTFNLDTNSPTIGDGSSNNAAAVIFHAAFPTIILGNDGEAILLTGSVTLTGITSTAPGTFHQLRFGLFDRLGSSTTNGWLGYFAASSTSANAGVVRQRSAGNSDLFLSNSGSVIVASTANPPHSRTGALLADDTYSFSMQLTRDGSNYDLVASLFGGPDGNYFDSFTLDNLVPAATESFSFDNVGFLLGAAMNTDQAQFNNVDVAFIPEPGSCALLAISGALIAGRRRARASR